MDQSESGEGTSSRLEGLFSPCFGDANELKDVEEALSLNLQLDQSLKQLEYELLQKLIECRRKLHKIRNTSNRNQETNDHPDVYDNYFGKLTCNNEPVPDNEDTIKIKKMKLVDKTKLVPLKWTTTDKRKLSSILLNMSRKIAEAKIIEEIKQIENKSTTESSDTILNFKLKAKHLKDELLNLKNKELEEIVLPLDKEYDWEEVAHKMKGKYSICAIRSMWKLCLHPSINKTNWGNREHTNLLNLVKKHRKQNWDKVAQELKTNRTEYQCFEYYRLCESKKNPRPWTPDEEQLLLHLVQKFKNIHTKNIPFARVAAQIEGRTRLQVYNKYLKMTQHKKGRFSAEEDAIILNGVETYKYDFDKIKELLPGRSVVQIINRFKLIGGDSNQSIVWTVKDDQKLMKLMDKQGSETNFSKLTKYFIGRSRSHLRSRYKTLSKWMQWNPNVDISKAPRREARCLNHGSAASNLNEALINFEKKAKTKNKPSSTKTCVTIKDELEDTSEDNNDKAITLLLYNRQQKNKPESPPVVKMIKEEKPKPINADNIRSILYLLEANLDFQSFRESEIASQHPTLLEEDFFSPSVINFKKGDEKRNCKCRSNVNCELPPSYLTITGCSMLMTAENDNIKDTPKRHFIKVMKNNKIFRRQYFNLVDRYVKLFRWPMVLSYVPPKK